MSFTCDSCRRRANGTGQRTVTGRVLCASCHDTLTGMAAGIVAGGGTAEAIATAGWFSRLRARRRPRGDG
ncbi:hypothetical protein [Angustibacter luteus]|uniref:Uncharacterized protein n=1 Tax=Angustibacter luteus TaxID=658456 RepID=A0ABW1JGI2_9ACTN